MSDETTSKWLIDATDETFEKQVIQRSKSTLCIVDFWAEWCAPCKTLSPILEELATEFDGKFMLVKIDAEQAQKTSMEFGVQSLPAVFAVSGEEVIDGFAGVLPKEQIKEWIEQVLARNDIGIALNLIEHDPTTAEANLRAILEKTPDQPEALVGMASVLVKQDRDNEALEIITKLEERGFLEPEAERVKAKIELKTKGHVDLDSAIAKAQASPDDLNIQFALANAYVGHQKLEDAFEICLLLVQRDKKGIGDEARQLMVDVFKTLPPDSDLTHVYRKKLSLMMY